MYNNKSNTYLHPTTGIYSAIGLSICDPYLFLDFNWKVHDDTCGSDHFLILLENSTDEFSKRTQSWNLEKTYWNGFKTSCLAQLIPEANKKQCGRHLLFYEHPVKHN